MLNKAAAEIDAQQSDAVVKELRSRREPIPDILLRVDVLKTTTYQYQVSSGAVIYGIELSSALIEPSTGRLLGQPSIPAIRRESEPQRYVIVNGQYYSGFDYVKSATGILQNLAGSAFRVVANALINALPSSAQVTAIRDGRITLDRGTEAGILPDETMIIFDDRDGNPEPIAVAKIEPGYGRSIGTIAQWKDSSRAREIASQSTGNNLNVANMRLFAVSVGAPANYNYCRMWEYYLAAVEVGFLNGSNMVFQLLLATRNDAVPIVRNLLPAQARAAVEIS